MTGTWAAEEQEPQEPQKAQQKSGTWTRATATATATTLVICLIAFLPAGASGYYLSDLPDYSLQSQAQEPFEAKSQYPPNPQITRIRPGGSYGNAFWRQQNQKEQRQQELLQLRDYIKQQQQLTDPARQQQQQQQQLTPSPRSQSGISVQRRSQDRRIVIRGDSRVGGGPDDKDKQLLMRIFKRGGAATPGGGANMGWEEQTVRPVVNFARVLKRVNEADYI